MLRRSFVSISFSSLKKIQIVQLDSAKKKVKKFLSIDKPAGLTDNLRVQNEKLLAKLLKDVWKKYKIRERSVGIVIPEFLTFTKTLSLPKLSVGDLDEAVRWQAHEFLPDKPEDLVLDWKIVKEEKVNYQTLAVAIRKDILQGYVRAASSAGLFPLVVETPSLSLARMSDGADVGRLIIYESLGEVILIVAHGERIVGSSVVNIEDHAEVVRIAKRMIKHYGDTEVEKVVVSGPQINDAIAKKFQADLERSVSWVKPSVAGLNATQFHEYLIPISLQLKDPAEPADETTINLLPTDLVKKYAKGKLQSQIWSLSLLVTLIVWVCFFSILGVFLFLGQQINSFQGVDVSKRISPEKAEAIKQIEEINRTSDKILAISEAMESPQSVINSINQAKPNDLSISKYKVNLDAGTVSIIGISSTRQSLIDFKDAIEEINDFSLVQIPITSFEKEADLEFIMSFRYLPAISKSSDKKR